jgi:hypothetical protein
MHVASETTLAEPDADLTSALEDIYAFIQADAFQNLLEELWAQEPSQRLAFVDEVILSDRERRRRNVFVPDGMAVQKSHFADHRPTLFCVSKKLAREPWKVTITFDNDEGTDEGYERISEFGGWIGRFGEK